MSSITLAARVHTLDGRVAAAGADGRRVRGTRRRRDGQRPISARKSVVGFSGREYGRSYTGKEVVREIDWLMDM